MYTLCPSLHSSDSLRLSNCLSNTIFVLLLLSCIDVVFGSLLLLFPTFFLLTLYFTQFFGYAVDMYSIFPPNQDTKKKTQINYTFLAASKNKLLPNEIWLFSTRFPSSWIITQSEVGTDAKLSFQNTPLTFFFFFLFTRYFALHSKENNNLLLCLVQLPNTLDSHHNFTNTSEQRHACMFIALVHCRLLWYCSVVAL